MAVAVTLDKALDKAYQNKSLEEILDAPVPAHCQGRDVSYQAAPVWVVVIRVGGPSGSGGWRRSHRRHPRRPARRDSSSPTRCAARTGRARPD